MKSKKQPNITHKKTFKSKSFAKTIKRAASTSASSDSKWIRQLINQINGISDEFDAIQNDVSVGTKKQMQLLQSLLIKYNSIKKQIPESYYPLLNNPKFNTILQTHSLFKPYSIPANPTKIADLIKSFKSNVEHQSTRDEPYFILTPIQKFLRNFISPSSPYRGLFIWHGTGVGKCHARDTELIMYDGNVRKIQDIKCGDLLMGSNSESRTVLSLGTGYDKMYKINLIQSNPHLRTISDSFTANSVHILVLYNTATAAIEEHEITTFISMPITERTKYLLIKTNCIWNPCFYTYISPSEAYAAGQHQIINQNIIVNSAIVRINYIRGLLHDCFVNNKYVTVKCNKSTVIMKSIIFIARSLGLNAIAYDDYIYIDGNMLQYIWDSHNYTRFNAVIMNYYKFNIEYVGEDIYYGVTLDGDQRYLLEDFIITHNTCTAITIAEHLKYIIDMEVRLSGNSHPMITILRADEFKRQMFDIGKIKDGQPEKQCTGMTYLKSPILQHNLTKCIKGKMEDCNELESKVMKEIKQYYNLTNPGKWANDIKKKIDYLSRGLAPTDKEIKIRRLIRDLFNNTILIIDEAHNYILDKGSSSLSSILKDIDEDDGGAAATTPAVAPPTVEDDISGKISNAKDKIVSGILKIVVKYAQNMRLILMTATPMFDTSSDIVSILNYLLMNDKRPQLVKHEIFDIGGQLKPSGIQKLVEGSRGYVSYMRGNNPYDFPLRLSAKYNIPHHIFNIAKYPKFNLFHKPIVDKLEFLDLVDCPLHGEQLKILELYGKNHTPSIKDEEHKMAGFSPLEEDEIIKKLENDIDIDSTVAYNDERQISNFVYQSLADANNNITHCYGSRGLAAVTTHTLKGTTGITYQFKDPEYGKRFLLPELKQWSSKLASIIENVKQSNGPVFIYSFYVASGAIPIALALEMNGYQRYKMHGTPLLQNPYKSDTNMGDYIIYTSDQRLSTHTMTYLNLRERMTAEKSVKVFIGSGTASEGINLFGYREVHILDPWHHINKIEQSIGRVIRQGSHSHLPPQQRNVSVYLYAATMGKIESRDLYMYKQCEKKAKNSGFVEKILKENAIDCIFTMPENQYTTEQFPDKVPCITSHNKTVMVSLADEPFSKYCFYQWDCNYKCNVQTNSAMKLSTIPYVSDDYDKLVEEYVNKIKYLLMQMKNIAVEDIKIKLNIVDDNLFQSILLYLVSTPILDPVNDKTYIIAMSDNYLRLIPQNMNRDITLYKQMHPMTDKHIYAVHLKEYLQDLDYKKKRILESHEVNYNDIIKELEIKYDEYVAVIGMSATLSHKMNNDFLFNVDITQTELLYFIFTKLIYSYKLIILKKMTNKLISHHKLSDFESKLEPVIMKNIVKYNAVYPERNSDIYGFIIANYNEIELYKYNIDKGDCVADMGNIKRYLENVRRTKQKINEIFGYLIYDSTSETVPKFKIVDFLGKGNKKSVTGITCGNISNELIKKYMKLLYVNRDISAERRTQTKTISKMVQCNDIELGFQRISGKNGKIWYMNPEEYILYN